MAAGNRHPRGLNALLADHIEAGPPSREDIAVDDRADSLAKVLLELLVAQVLPVGPLADADRHLSPRASDKEVLAVRLGPDRVVARQVGLAVLEADHYRRHEVVAEPALEQGVGHHVCEN